MYKMKSDINFSLTHEMLENEENERIHTSYAQEKAISRMCFKRRYSRIGEYLLFTPNNCLRKDDLFQFQIKITFLCKYC